LCSALSNDGQWIVVSDSLELRLFRLELIDDNDIRVRKMGYLTANIEPARCILFTPDCTRLLAASLDNRIQVIDVSNGRVIHEFYDHRNGVSSMPYSSISKESLSTVWIDANLARLPGIIRTLTVSHDGQWVACGDSLNRIFIYHLDSLQLHSIVPIREAPHVYLAFEPCHNHLIVVYSNRFFVLYDVDRRDFAEFSRRYPSESEFPKSYLNRKEKICGIAFDDASPYTALFYGLDFICFVDFQKVSHRMRHDLLTIFACCIVFYTACHILSTHLNPFYSILVHHSFSLE
jgi:U3 small nucleolar RNA-associated protein 4